MPQRFAIRITGSTFIDSNIGGIGAWWREYSSLDEQYKSTWPRANTSVVAQRLFGSSGGGNNTFLRSAVLYGGHGRPNIEHGGSSGGFQPGCGNRPPYVKTSGYSSLGSYGGLVHTRWCT